MQVSEITNRTFTCEDLEQFSKVDRSDFVAGLATVVTQCDTKKAVCAVIDIDHFKLLTYSQGLAAGGDIIRHTEEFLVTHLAGYSSLFCHLGADEFAVVLHADDFDDAERQLEILVRLFRWTPARFGNSYVAFTISVGFVEVDVLNMSADDLLSLAQLAVAKAKDEGGGRAKRFSPADSQMLARRQELLWGYRVMDALSKNNLTLYQQSIVRLSNDHVAEHKVELLLRLRDDQGNLHGPERFLSSAEKLRMMGEVDRWVLRTAFKSVRLRLERGENVPVVSVNLSTQSLEDASLASFIGHLFDTYAVPGEKFCFELTESMAISNFDQVVELAKYLQSLGCSVALDDFGSGYATFDYLKRLPLNYLKIDGSIIQSIVSDPVSQAIVAGILGVTRQMGLSTIAEFASSRAIVDKLLEFGLDYGQGYFFDEPKPFSDATR